MSDFYILDGHTPVPVGGIEVWARAFEISNRHVATTQIDGVRVSTVFLGLDHSHGAGPPLLFETMIFGGDHDQFQERCSTWNEAEDQHERVCAMVRRNLQ